MRLKYKYGRKEKSKTLFEVLDSDFNIDELRDTMIVIFEVLADNNMLTQDHIDIIFPGYEIVKEKR